MAQGCNLTATEPKEGKISLKAAISGLLKVNSEKLIAVNSVGEVMIATKRGNTCVREGDNVAGMRVIPLVIDQKKMDEARAAAGSVPLVSVIPIRKKKAAILATGSEVFKGRIKDTFTPVVEGKLAAFDAEIMLPNVYVRKESLPLTKNGKIDRKTLTEEYLKKQDGKNGLS